MVCVCVCDLFIESLEPRLLAQAIILDTGNRIRLYQATDGWAQVPSYASVSWDFKQANDKTAGFLFQHENNNNNKTTPLMCPPPPTKKKLQNQTDNSKKHRKNNYNMT